jgi:hypothetical protein
VPEAKKGVQQPGDEETRVTVGEPLKAVGVDWSRPDVSGVLVSKSDVRSGTRSPGPVRPQPLRDAAGRVVPVAGLYEGSTLFLVCGGPSLQETPLQLLGLRGVVVMAVNNAWLKVRPHMWVGVDPPGRFADVGWRDPAIMKMLPMSHKGSRIRSSEGGEITETAIESRLCPNVRYFSRDDGFSPEAFFGSRFVQWGATTQVDGAGIPASRSVMLAALKLAWCMGFHKVCLLGADFHMPIEGQAYAWDEDKSKNGRNANNATYLGMRYRLSLIMEEARKKGYPFEIVNCTPGSRLVEVRWSPFYREVEEASKSCDRAVIEKGWYK